jgi:hypothetical protein
MPNPVANDACTKGVKSIRSNPRADSVNTIHPNSASPSRHPINVFTNKQTVVGQAITFYEIPTTAANCSLSWAAFPGSAFLANGQADVNVFELISLPTGPVTWNSLHDPANNRIGKRVGQPAFTGWGVGDEKHTVGDVDCMRVMSFFTRIPEGQEGSVAVSHNGGSGWLLTFDC